MSSHADASVHQAPAGGEIPGRKGLWRLVLEVFMEHRGALVGVGIVVFMVLFSFVGPLLYHTDQVHTNLAQASQAPSRAHLLGTNEVGYDQLGRLMLGGQTSLEVGFAAAILATVIGTLWGAVSGFTGGALDAVMMRVVDGFIAIPTLFLLLYLTTVFQANTAMLILVIGFVAWLGPARLVRGEALKLRVLEYVDAVRMMGGSRRRIVGQHIIPNTIGTVMVNMTFQIADAVLAVAALSFLGLGIPPPAANWGGMLSDGINYSYAGYWWLIYPPGLVIVLTVAAFNFIGDGLRDAFEQRLRRD
ncbi:MAG TPA: ABC transporter permease [Streptosporangiales bacterium]